MILLRAVIGAACVGLVLASMGTALLLLPGPRSFGPARERFPLWEESRFHTIESLIQADRRLEALELLRHLDSRHPDSAWIQFRLGVVLERLGKHEEALAAVSRASSLTRLPRPSGPSTAARIDSDLTFRRARLLVHLHRDAEALPLAAEAARSPRAPAGAAALASRLLRSSGRSDEARALLQWAIRKGATDAGAWRELGDLRAEAGEPQRAADSYRRALDADPCDLESLERAASLEHGRGDPTAALPFAERVVECPGEMEIKARLFLLRARLLLELKDPDRALSSLLSALEAGYDEDDWSRAGSPFARAFAGRSEFRMMIERFAPGRPTADGEPRRDT